MAVGGSVRVEGGVSLAGCFWVRVGDSLMGCVRLPECVPPVGLLPVVGLAFYLGIRPGAGSTIDVLWCLVGTHIVNK